MITRMLSKKPEWLKSVFGHKKKKLKELTDTLTKMRMKNKFPKTSMGKSSKVSLKKFTLLKHKFTSQLKALSQP